MKIETKETDTNEDRDKSPKNGDYWKKSRTGYKYREKEERRRIDMGLKLKGEKEKS